MQYHVNHYILKPITRQKIIQLEDILIKLYEEKEMSKKIITSKSRRVELRKNAYRHLPFAAFYLIETILYYHRKSAFRKAYAVVNFDEKKDSHENTNY